jgi:hypothetical protein
MIITQQKIDKLAQRLFEDDRKNACLRPCFAWTFDKFGRGKPVRRETVWSDYRGEARLRLRTGVER